MLASAEVEVRREALWELDGLMQFPPQDWPSYYAHLWDNVALVAALVAVHESGWPWPSWARDVVPEDCDRDWR